MEIVIITILLMAIVIIALSMYIIEHRNENAEHWSLWTSKNAEWELNFTSRCKDKVIRKAVDACTSECKVRITHHYGKHNAKKPRLNP